ncbi:MAG: hypothetical protein K8S16_12240 [Bacteroidales bacterium]|nr:hypothetical protein [Bacteroidales bacterium]
MLTLSQYKSLSSLDRNKVIHTIIKILGKEFALKEILPIEYSYLPVIKHFNTNVDFVYIFGGETKVGFDLADEKKLKKIVSVDYLNIEDLRPSYKTLIDGFLISRSPVTNNNMLLEYPNEVRNENMNFPFLTNFEMANKFAVKLGMDIPNEIEWEYLSRGGFDHIFAFGDVLPDEEVLAKWLNWDLYSKDYPLNGYGVYGLYFGEWTNDFF